MRIDRKDLDGLSVLLTMPIRDAVPWPTWQACLETQALMLKSGIPFDIKASVDGVTVNVGRSLGADNALQGPHNRIFMVDADMWWKPEDFLRLVALSTKMDVVCGAYCMRRDPPEFMFAPDDDDPVANEWGCLPFKGLGLGFTIVNRVILEKLAEVSPQLKFPNREKMVPHIFTDGTTENGEYQGEDMAFFSRVRALGFGVWVDPTVVLGHVGQKIYSAPLLDHIVKLEEAA